jgi:hypothetical protein
MKSFSEKTAELVFSELKKHVTYTYAKNKLDRTKIYSAKIESKHLSANCTAYFIFSENDTINASLNDDKIYINIASDFHQLIQDYFNKFDTKLKTKITNKYNELVKTINHELVHFIDPKTNKLKDKSLKTASDNEKEISKLESQLNSGKDVSDKLKLAYEKYLKFPWEIDAYISSEAESRMQSYFRKGLTKNMIQKVLSNIEPKTPIEKFYKTVPEIWKRYNKYLYKLLENHFNKE